MQPLELYRAEDRQSVLRALEDFVTDQVDITMSADAFLGSETDEERKRALELHLVYDSWMTWAILDDPSADAIAGFTRRYGNRLSPGQRRYLDALRATELRLYDVVEVELDVGLHLRDRLDRTDITVLERRATQQLVAGDVLAVRVIAGKAPGTLELEHPVLPLTQLDADGIVEEIRSVRRRVRRKLGEAAATAGVAIETPIIVNEWWVDRLNQAAQVRERGIDMLRTAEGDRVAFHAVAFAVRDRRALLARLRADEAFVSGGETDTLIWADPEHNRILGEVRIGKDALRAEVMSVQRAAAFQAKLTEIGGDLVTFTALEPIEPNAPDDDDARREEPEIPTDVRAEIVAGALERHYATWPDIPLPALGGLTPREAAKHPRERKRLIALLRDFDADAERQRRAGESTYDFARLWRELGLQRSRLLRT